MLALLFGSGLLPVLVHSHTVGARTELFVRNARPNDDFELRVFAAGDGDDLETVHLRHVQIDNQQVECFRFEQRKRPRSRRGSVNFRTARERLESLPIHFQKILVIIDQ